MEKGEEEGADEVSPFLPLFPPFEHRGEREKLPPLPVAMMHCLLSFSLIHFEKEEEDAPPRCRQIKIGISVLALSRGGEGGQKTRRRPLFIASFCLPAAA